MSDSIDRVFVHALNTVKRIPRTGSARPPPAARLKLYGLYKQSMEGDVSGIMRRPTGDSTEETAEREKWDAWSSQSSLSRPEAKRNYITTLIETMHAYASTTPEARELVAELEFIWDQVKSNAASASSASSPAGLLSQRIEAEREGSGKLRVLRPVSDADDADSEKIQYEEALSSPEDEAEDPFLARSKDYDIRNRKWRKRIEVALVKMTAEVAALREQMEARRLFGRGPRRRVWVWIQWVVGALIRHVLVDAVVLGVLYLWLRRRGDQRLEQGIKMLVGIVRDRGKRRQLLGRKGDGST